MFFVLFFCSEEEIISYIFIKNFSWDFLTVYDGDSSASSMLGRYCGSALPPNLISSTNNMFIHFHSDEHSTGNGFNLEYNPLDCAEQCSTVMVTMNNGALESQGSLQGMYQISDPVNGIQSWTSVSHAIWYSLDILAWMIATQNYIGGNICSIYTFADYDGLDDPNKLWQYWDGSNWITADANDINVTCTC